jgi:cytochrome c553
MKLHAAAVVALAALLASCDNMQHQPYERAFTPSKRVPGQSSAQLPPPHTVARDAPNLDDPAATGREDGRWVKRVPLTLSREFVERGGERFGIFCADCHGADGSGEGIVVLRGFPRPKAFGSAVVRAEVPGRLYDAISNGTGVMYGFADRIEEPDRWAIVAYILALERTREASIADVPPAEREKLFSQ